MFENCKKLKILDIDPTLTRMNSLQRYLNSLCKRVDITKSEYDMMRPKNAKEARTHSLPKTRKDFTDILKFD